MSIQFPILNISLSNLSSQDLEETHIGDLWDYPGDNSCCPSKSRHRKVEN